LIGSLAAAQKAIGDWRCRRRVDKGRLRDKLSV
jgi:hypothetical protein